MNVGILGLGSIGLRHASNSIKLRHNVFGYDVDYNKSNDLKKIGGEFISQKNRLLQIIDVCIIATPNEFHLDDLTSLIKKNKHCLVEKPISHEILETSKIIEIANKKNLTICVAQNLRFHPAVKKAKEWISGGRIGRIIWSNLTCSSYLPDWRKGQDFLKGYTNNKKTGGVIFDSIHELDLANYLIGPAHVLSCNAKSSGILNLKCEDIADIILEHENGSNSTIHLDYITKPKIRITQIVGEKGQINIDISKRILKLISRNGKKKEVQYFKKNINKDYIEELKSFFYSVNNNSKPFCDASEAIDILKQAIDARRFASIS